VNADGNDCANESTVRVDCRDASGMENNDIIQQYGDAIFVILLAVPFLFYIIFAAGVGIIAKTRGRSFFGWSLLSIFITPLLAGLIVLLIKSHYISKPPLSWDV
jgi:hypothetical protein